MPQTQKKKKKKPFCFIFYEQQKRCSSAPVEEREVARKEGALLAPEHLEVALAPPRPLLERLLDAVRRLADAQVLLHKNMNLHTSMMHSSERPSWQWHWVHTNHSIQHATNSINHKQTGVLEKQTGVLRSVGRLRTLT